MKLITLMLTPHGHHILPFKSSRSRPFGGLRKSISGDLETEKAELSDSGILDRNIPYRVLMYPESVKKRVI